MNLRLSIACSVLLHLALLAALTAGVWLNAGEHRTGPGEAVAVWIESPEGSAAPVPPAPAVARQEDGARQTAEPYASSAAGAGGGESEGAEGTEAGAGTGGSRVLSAIWKRIDRSKYYPAAARRRGISGSPRVSFSIGPDGSIAWVKLVESSGEALLDDAALATVQRAAPLPCYPAPITLAVKYSMDE